MPDADGEIAAAAAAFESWLTGLDEGWWDDAGDAGSFIDSLEEAFFAGFTAGREGHS